MPHRQVFQKTALLAGLVSQSLKVGNKEKALEHYNNLLTTVEDFEKSQQSIDSKVSLMFVKGDMDGAWSTTPDRMQERITAAKNSIEEYCPKA